MHAPTDELEATSFIEGQSLLVGFSSKWAFARATQGISQHRPTNAAPTMPVLDSDEGNGVRHPVSLDAIGADQHPIDIGAVDRRVGSVTQFGDTRGGGLRRSFPGRRRQDGSG